MEFKNVVKERRSIRNYKKDSVDKKVIDEILKDAILSPSAHNRQPWHYFVLTKNCKRKIEGLIIEYITQNDVLTYYQKIMRKNIEFIKQAPVYILCYIEEENSEMQDILSMGASIEHINLSAVDKGLSTVWVGTIVDFEEIINNYLKIDNMKLVASVVLGYKNEEPKSQIRKEIKEVVTYL